MHIFYAFPLFFLQNINFLLTIPGISPFLYLFFLKKLVFSFIIYSLFVHKFRFFYLSSFFGLLFLTICTTGKQIASIFHLPFLRRIVPADAL